ncbi:hypothetical protein [Nonomuraea sp. NPDC050202]|uniref:hypothetical protein n=1 Tax=Nonomuraea sp. NPDC050202 TaxID=3155035 RepID=UPI0033FE53AE
MMFNSLGFDLECTACGVTGPHRYDGEETVCTTCGTPREIEPELIAAVLDMKFCAWCRETLPASHRCRSEEPPCEDPTRLDRCGRCQTDLDLQVMDLFRRDAALYVSPSDLDGGA